MMFSDFSFCWLITFLCLEVEELLCSCNLDLGYLTSTRIIRSKQVLMLNHDISIFRERRQRNSFDQIYDSLVYFNVSGNRNTLGETISGQSTGRTVIETDISKRQMKLLGRILVFL